MSEEDAIHHFGPVRPQRRVPEGPARPLVREPSTSASRASKVHDRILESRLMHQVFQGTLLGDADVPRRGGGGNKNFEITTDGTFIVNTTTRTEALEITGGADLAEPFEMARASRNLPRGSVVVIDEDNPGKLKLSEEAYDKRVAGVISGAGGLEPGVTLKQSGVVENGQYVALTGRVYVWADASIVPIRAGDLLTTSETPGHASKVIDHERAQGAILGKAMTSLEDGTGLVLILVTLQ